MNYRKKVRLGDVLVKKGIIDENQLQTALSRQREQGKMLGEMVIALGYATQRDINEALCDSLGIDFVDMRETEISDDVLSMLDENISNFLSYARRNNIYILIYIFILKIFRYDIIYVLV